MLWHNLHRKWDEMGTYYPVNMWMIVNSRAAGTLLDHPSRKRLCMRFTTAFRAAICAWVKEGFSKTRWVKKLLSPALTIRMLLILWYFHKNSKMKVIWKKKCYSVVFVAIPMYFGGTTEAEKKSLPAGDLPLRRNFDHLQQGKETKNAGDLCRGSSWGSNGTLVERRGVKSWVRTHQWLGSFSKHLFFLGGLSSYPFWPRLEQTGSDANSKTPGWSQNGDASAIVWVG